MEFDFQQQPGLTLLDRNLVRDGEPLVSIITPFYNGGKYFEQTFNCVMNQTFPWFEWIIVDDGSTKQDDLAVLDQFALKDPRIRVYHKKMGVFPLPATMVFVTPKQNLYFRWIVMI